MSKQKKSDLGSTKSKKLVLNRQIVKDLHVAPRSQRNVVAGRSSSGSPYNASTGTGG